MQKHIFESYKNVKPYFFRKEVRHEENTPFVVRLLCFCAENSL